MQNSDILSEETTIFAQLKYALPLKFGKVLHGTKAFFLHNDDLTKQKITAIKGEYADIAFWDYYACPGCKLFWANKPPAYYPAKWKAKSP